MYRAMTWMMGWVASMRKGRARASCRTLETVLSVSNSVPMPLRKRKVIISALLWEKPQARFQTM